MVLVGRTERWPGSRLIDAHGDAVGTVARVRLDEGGGAWVVADLGRLTPWLVPVPAGDAIGFGGQVTVPYSRTTIRLAPELVRADDRISVRDADRLHAHYGLATRVIDGRAAI